MRRSFQAISCSERCVRVLPMKNRLGIYIQVPFCQTKCTYCNFHTGVVSSARFAPYVDAVCREIATVARFMPPPA